MIRRAGALLLLLAALAACSQKPPPLPHDVYIWQRAWTPAVGAAVGDATGSVSGWRVLGAELDREGIWRLARPDHALLAATGKPVVLVVRIEGQLARWDGDRLRAAVLALAGDWRRDGLTVAAIEIDHDCATARLPAYAEFLRLLRAGLPKGMLLSLTALPTWLGSPALDGVLAHVDEAVLQVHAVSDARGGLFEARRAHAWMVDFGTRMHRPWRVALPAYGSRVVWDTQGRIAAIESERLALIDGAVSSELIASPQDMADFLTSLDRDRPAHLAGITWFRLPASGDMRAWSLPTWRAVVAGQPLRPRLTVMAQGAETSGLYDLILANDGNSDAALPERIVLDGRCAAADGVNGYGIERNADGLALRRAANGLLRPGVSRSIGWARCGSAAPGLRIDSPARRNHFM